MSNPAAHNATELPTLRHKPEQRVIWTIIETRVRTKRHSHEHRDTQPHIESHIQTQRHVYTQRVTETNVETRIRTKRHSYKQTFHSRRRARPLPSDQFSIFEQLLRRNVQRFRGGLVLKAHRLFYHSTLGLRAMKKKKKKKKRDQLKGCVDFHQTAKTRIQP